MSEDVWYGPQDEWPRHPKKHFRDALDYACAAGWHLREISGHSFPKVYCCRDPDECCSYLVFSSGRGGESAAGSLTNLVDRCTHGPVPAPSPAQDWVEGIAARLDQVQTMLVAAGDCLSADAGAAAAYDLLDQAGAAMGDVEQLLAAAQTAEDQAIEVVTDRWSIINAQAPGLRRRERSSVGCARLKTAAAETVPDAVAVMDPFHVVALAGDALDRCRQLVQQETRGHRGRSGDPLYGIRRVLRTGADLLTDRQQQRLTTVFADDQHLQVEATWGIYQRIVAGYRNPDRRAGRTELTATINVISKCRPYSAS